MLKTTVLAAALALGLAVPAKASALDLTTHRSTAALTDTTVVGVTADRPNPVGTIVTDAIGGAVLGGGISAATQASDHTTSVADRSYLTPATEHRDVGFSAPVGAYAKNF